jgi:hypothetical protein
MSENSVEYCSLLYVPNMLSDEGVSIAGIFIDPIDIENGICTMAFAADWQKRVRRLDPHADLKMLGALLAEIRRRLLSKDQRSDMIYQLEHSFSNVIQVSQRQKCAVGSIPETIDVFAQELLEKTSQSLSRIQAA